MVDFEILFGLKIVLIVLDNPLELIACHSLAFKDKTRLSFRLSVIPIILLLFTMLFGNWKEFYLDLDRWLEDNVVALDIINILAHGSSDECIRDLAFVSENFSLFYIAYY